MVNSPHTASLSHLESLWLSLLQPVGEGWESLCDYSATFTISLSPGELISHPNISGTTLLKKEEVSNWLSALPVRLSISALRHCDLSTGSEFQSQSILWVPLLSLTNSAVADVSIYHTPFGGERRKYYIFHRVCVRIKWELSVKWISSYVFSLTSTQKKSPSSVCPSSIKLHMSYDYTYRTILFFGK